MFIRRRLDVQSVMQSCSGQWTLLKNIWLLSDLTNQSDSSIPESRNATTKDCSTLQHTTVLCQVHSTPQALLNTPEPHYNSGCTKPNKTTQISLTLHLCHPNPRRPARVRQWLSYLLVLICTDNHPSYERQLQRSEFPTSDPPCITISPNEVITLHQ